MSAHKICEVVSGRLIAGYEDAYAISCSIDSREISSGCLFAAFDGASFDAHAFILDAFTQGAHIALVSKEAEYDSLLCQWEDDISRAVILVPNMLEALQNLAAFQRKILSDEVLVVAITGSTGKTSTKEFCAAALEATYGKTVSTWANQNNELGVPLTILRVTEDTRALIVEMGMRSRGEIEFLSKVTRPHVAIITGSGSAHVEILGSTREIAKAKAEIFCGLEGHRGSLREKLSQGYGILPSADDFQQLFCATCKAPSFLVGFENEPHALDADLLLTNLRFDEKVCGTVKASLYDDLELHSCMPGKHHLLNQAFVIALIYIIGADPHLAADAMSRTQLSGMRYKKEYDPIRDITVINDAYNANPTSVRGSITTFSLESSKRRIVVLGDMLELGDLAESAHRDIGVLAAKSGIDALFAIGKYGGLMVESAKAEGLTQSYSYEIANIDRLGEDLSRFIQDGDTLLIKGSRALALERLLEKLGLNFVCGIC